MDQFPISFRQWLAIQPFDSFLCGMGMLAAATNLSHYLFSLPRRDAISEVILLGIAGAYDPALEVGSALEFDGVACYGIGLGSQANFQSPTAAGWKFTDPKLGDSYEPIPLSRSHPPNSWLLTCASSALDPHDVDFRRTNFPNAIAEDMEAYGIAMVCHQANLPLRIIRGISNRAGDRHLAAWKTAEAIKAATNLLIQTYPN